MSNLPYAELQVTSHFSFLRGASSCEALFERARDLGLPALGIADRNTLAGIVRAHQAAKETGVRLVVGCRLDLADGMSVLVYPMDRPAYARLCRLLSLGKGRAGKGKCLLHFEDLAAYGEGFMAILVPDRADETTRLHLARMAATFGPRASMALTLRRRPNDQLRLHELAEMAAEAGVAPVVTNDVLYADPSQRMLQDVVTCIRHTTTIDAAGFRRERHADRYLKPPEEMQRLFPRYPQALARSVEILQRCRFSMDELAYQYPEEKLFPDLSPQEALEKLVAQGVPWRYPQGVPEKVRAALAHELALIRKLQYAPYFLTVNSIVRYAKSRDILCQGARFRGQFRRVLRARHHRHRSRRKQSAVRAVRFGRPARAAGYRCGFRASASGGGGHPVGLRNLWPRTRPRSVRHRYPLSCQGGVA